VLSVAVLKDGPGASRWQGEGHDHSPFSSSAPLLDDMAAVPEHRTTMAIVEVPRGGRRTLPVDRVHRVVVSFTDRRPEGSPHPSWLPSGLVCSGVTYVRHG
jgi:hypothetical protein